jgi:hypothetical protein
MRLPVLSCAAFYLQSGAFSKWAMLGSNQRPPPCKGGLIVFQAFPQLFEQIRRLLSLLTLRSRLRAQPQGNVGGLHRLPYHAYQVASERVQIRLIPERHREGF